jgi:hypothetical protein
MHYVIRSYALMLIIKIKISYHVMKLSIFFKNKSLNRIKLSK